MSRLAALLLAACYAGSVAWTGALVDAPSALERVAPVLPGLHAPAWAERWLYNPRERTATGIDALQDGRRDDGVEALDSALRQAPDDPRALYNAGTGRLLADSQPKKAAALLERAAAGAPPELAPRAYYNLGNARLAAGDAPGAVEAYRQSLRLDPSLGPAKRNLEIALARRDRDRPRAGKPKEAPGGKQKGEQEPSDQSGGTEPQEQQKADGQQDRQDRTSGARPESSQPPSPTQGEAAGGEGQDADRVGQAGAPGPGAPSQQDQSLLHFDDQPDMTASEAAALLDAIDQLERTERRRAALARAEAAGESTEEDW